MTRRKTAPGPKRLSDEHKAKIAESVRRHYADPKLRAETSAKMKAYHARAKAALALLAEQEASDG